MKYSDSDLYDGVCTAVEYWEQFDMPRLKVGGLYVVQPNHWAQEIYRIIYIDETVALAELIEGLRVGGVLPPCKKLYQSSGLARGHKCGDNRTCYRLQALSTIKEK